MKYTRLNARLEINHIWPSQMEGLTELTDEQASQAAALRAAKKIPIFYQGQVTTAKDEGIRWNFATGEYEPIPAPVRTISKLVIRRQLREWGKEAAFESVLDSVPHARVDWDDSLELRTNDPLFAANKDAFKAALGLSDEQFTSLLAL